MIHPPPYVSQHHRFAAKRARGRNGGRPIRALDVGYSGVECVSGCYRLGGHPPRRKGYYSKSGSWSSGSDKAFLKVL
jgi:hypothetical protein